MNNPAAPLPLSHADRDVLTKWARSESAPYRVVTRAKVLLMAGDGVANSHIATILGISRPTVLNWRARFRSDGLDSVGKVRPGRGTETGYCRAPSAGHRACHAAREASGGHTVELSFDGQGGRREPPRPSSASGTRTAYSPTASRRFAVAGVVPALPRGEVVDRPVRSSRS